MQSRYAKNPGVSHTCIYKKSRCTASLWRCTLMYNFNKKTIILLQNSQSLVCGGIGRVYLLYLFEISLSLGVIFLYDVVIAKV